MRGRSNRQLVINRLFISSLSPGLLSQAMSSSSSSLVTSWLSDTFLGKSRPSSDNVSAFVGCDKSTLDGLSEYELTWLLLFDVIDRKLYDVKGLDKQKKMFFIILKHEYNNMLNELEIRFDIDDIWARSHGENTTHA